MNLFAEEKQTQTLKNLWLPKGAGSGWGRGWTGDLGLAYAHGGTWNDWPMGTCCIAQRTLPNVLWSSMWVKKLKKKGFVSVYN